MLLLIIHATSYLSNSKSKIYSRSMLRIANARYNANAKSSILSNMCAIITRPFACSWMLKDRLLQFEQPVDIDIELNEHPTAMHIHKSATRRCLHRTSTRYALYAMKHCI